jgi:TrwC relaxase
MRFTITALGSAGDKPVGVVVGQIARYLIAPGQQSSPAAGLSQDPRPAEESVTRYYADRGDSPGRWLGQGAHELDLAGMVEMQAFTSVLAGRDPRTGARLISARGSAGRVAALGAGTVARRSPAGEALYTVADVAVVLGWSQADVRDAIAAGERLVSSRLIEALAGTVPVGTGTAGNGAGGPGRWTGTPVRATGTPDRAPRSDRDGSDHHPPGEPTDSGPDRDGIGMALVPFIDRDTTRYVGERELSRVEEFAARGISADDVLNAGDPGEEFAVPAAARLLGVRRGYLSRLCRIYLAHQDDITAALATGDTPTRAYLVCRRAEDGSYRVTRAELAAYTQRRRRPAVRVGYDVTATTEKSISVLALLGGPGVRRQVLAAIEAANGNGLGWLEYNAAAARASGHDIGITGWTAASFQHLTSRRLDPFVHHHNVIANTVVDEHGERRALDARPLYRNVAAASAIATAHVRWGSPTGSGLLGGRPGMAAGNSPGSATPSWTSSANAAGRSTTPSASSKTPSAEPAHSTSCNPSWPGAGQPKSRPTKPTSSPTGGSAPGHRDSPPLGSTRPLGKPGPRCSVLGSAPGSPTRPPPR